MCTVPRDEKWLLRAHDEAHVRVDSAFMLALSVQQSVQHSNTSVKSGLFLALVRSNRATLAFPAFF